VSLWDVSFGQRVFGRILVMEPAEIFETKGRAELLTCACSHPSLHKTRAALLVLFTGFILTASALAQSTASISLGWSPSPDPAVVGYNLYSGVASQTYTNIVSVGNVTNTVIGNLVPSATYYFSTRARDAQGNESPFSNEISYTVLTSGSSTPSNTPPTISSIPNQTINANSATSPLSFTVADAETPGANLTVSATSSNPTLVPNSGLVLVNNGTNYAVTITPATGQAGTALIALTVCDPSLCTTTSFQLTVSPLPTIVLSSPLEGTSFTAPATVTLSANVTANGRTITQVQFFNGNTLLGSAATAPYVLSWNNAAPGSYTVSASAIFDAGSGIVSSTGSTISVGLPPTLLPPWQIANIGTIVPTSSAGVTNGLYTVQSSGNLTSSSDNFLFLFQSLSGDGEIRAQVASVQNTSSSAIAGVMIREALTSSSKYALTGISPNGAFRWQRRSSTGGGTSTTKGGNGSLANAWVRLVRTGNTLLGYKSNDGANWTLINSSTINMAPNIYVGFVVASGTTSTMSSSTFTNPTVIP